MSKLLRGYRWLVVMGLTMICAVIAIMLMPCATEIKKVDEAQTQPVYVPIEHTVFYVDDMPCVFAREASNFRAGGVSCDWSKWKGE